MDDDRKPKEQLIRELTEARLLIKELKESASGRKQEKDSVQEWEDKFLAHFSLANDVMFSYDDHFRVLSVSPNVKRVLGYTPEELVGRTFHELAVLHPAYMPEAISNALQVLSGKTLYSSIYEFITKDGTRKFGEVSGVPLMRDGEVTAVITVARDITHRIRMQESLRESEERYRVTLESMPDAVSIICIENARYLYVNDAFCKTTGYPPEEVLGKSPFDLNLVVRSEDFEQYVDLIKAAGSVDSAKYQCRTKEGIILDVLLSVRTVVYGGKECLVMVMTDITAAKEAEEEKKRLEIQSQKMESIGTLARGIAHDFNNILTTIIGYTKMSMKDILSLTKGDKDLSVVRSDLNEVRKSALRARDIVDQILAFSRHAEKKHIPIELGSTIRESLRTLRTILPANIKIRENLAVPGMIMGDPGQIRQVMVNLCTNAAHAMNETNGELEVSLTRVAVDQNTEHSDPDLPPGPYLKLTVRDTGRGMTPKVMARVFDPYFTTKWRGNGTGLGLSVVHGIVKSHRGAITCRSVPREGTTFDIYFPQLSETAAPMEIAKVSDARIICME
jgi:PAS domain S-box-containing protein